MQTTRRDILSMMGASATALAVPSAHAAEFTLKYANNLPIAHPMNQRATEMAKAINEESKGRIEFQIYPNNQLGNDTDMLAQVRSGAIDFFTLSPLILGTVVPSGQISGVGFAFANYDQVWAAMDGELGAHVRAEIQTKSRLIAFEKIWDNGYRQITNSVRPINGPADLKGLKVRIPPSPFWVSMFKAFEAAPATINFAEVYSSLQTKVVDGQENPLALIFTAKLNEVQKYCSMTNHMWDGFWFLANERKFERLPKDLQEIIRRNANQAGERQRQDVRKLNDTVRADLITKGMMFNDTQADPFRAKLREAGFYKEWRDKFGAQAWALLEKYTGKLA